MKRIIIIALLYANVYAQSFTCVKTLNKVGCSLEFLNSTSTKIMELDLANTTWWKQSDGSFVLKDLKNQYTIKNDGCVVSPTFSNLELYFDTVRNGCRSGGGSVSITQPLETIDSTSAISRTECFKAIANTATFSIGDVLEVFTVYRNSGTFPNNITYQTVDNKTQALNVYTRLEDGTTTGVYPVAYSEVMPCEAYQPDKPYSIVYDKYQDLSAPIAIMVEDQTESRLNIDLSALASVYGVNTADVDFGTGHIVTISTPNPYDYTYSAHGAYDLTIRFIAPDGITYNLNTEVVYVGSFNSTAYNIFPTVYRALRQYTDVLSTNTYYYELENGASYGVQGFIISQEEYLLEQERAHEFSYRSEKRGVALISSAHIDLAIGDIISIQDALANYGGNPRIEWAKKITITNTTPVAGDAIIHIGGSTIDDNGTPYDRKEGYTFYQNGRLYNLRDIFVKNDNSSATRANFSIDIEY